MIRQVATGIDVSDRKLRLVRVQKNYRNTQLLAFAELDLPAGILQSGVIVQPPQFVQALKELPKRVAGSHWATRGVHVGLPEQISFMTTLSLDSTNKEQVETAAKRSLPLQDSEMYFDIAVSRTNKVASIAAARRDLVDMLLAQFDAANYEVIGIHVESEALAEALLPTPLAKAPISLIIDLGSARTTIAFVAHGAVYFTVSYPSVISAAGVDQQHLAGATQQAVTYVREHFSGVGALAQIILCGSGANLPQLDQWLGQLVQIPTQIGNALLHIKPNHMSKKMSQSTQFATAIGLALAA